MRLKAAFVLFVCVLLATSSAVFAQTNATTGTITGTITDSTGGVLPGVTVTVSNVNTGLTRSTQTEASGDYTISLLPPGTYKVEAALEGLGTGSRDKVTVLLGTSSDVDIAISTQLSEQITVTAEAPVVDTTQSDLTTAVTQDQIENLPILGRDFRDLVLLTPGVTEAFGGRVSLNGARGISSDFNIDGADSNNDFFGEQRGGTEQPFSFSQAAIREFQVIRSSYSAEYGKGVGATMNAITKSGTNDLEGELFYFLRDKDWAGDRPRTLVSGLSVTDNFEAKNSDQYGFAIGGPIVRDRFHFFANADFQEIAERVEVTDVRTDNDFIALPAATQTAFISKVEALLGHSIDDEFRYTTQEDQSTYLLKFDANLGTRHHVSIRDNYANFENFPSESASTLSAQGFEENIFNSIVGQAESVLTNSLFNQAILQYSKEERPIEPLNNEIPYIQIFGSAPFTFGQRDFLPNNTIEKKWQLKDSVTAIFDRHTVKAGFEYLDSDVLNYFPRELSGEYQFANIAAFLANNPNRFEQGIGRADIDPSQWGANQFDYSSWGVFIQDTWKIIPQLTLDLGVRYDLQDLPEPDRNIAPQYPEFLGNFENDDDNIAPRFGFAYDVFNNGRSVLRGGVGQYYNTLPTILLAGPIAEISGLYNRLSLNCSATVICPTFPNIFTETEIRNQLRSAADITIVGDDYEAQESVRTSLGFEQAIGRNYSVGIEGVYSKLDKQQRLINSNAVFTGETFGNLRQYVVNSPNRRYTAFNNVRTLVSDAEGKYTSISLVTRKLQTDDSRYSWLAHYTWSEAIDQDSNERSTSTTFSLDPFDPEISEGLADYNVEHKVVVSGTYEAPFGILISGIYNWRSGAPWTRTISGLGNGIGGLGVFTPVFEDSEGNLIDMTQASGLTRAELSTFLADRGAVLTDRNSEEQPNHYNLDMRLSKKFTIMGDYSVEVIGEVFNALADNIEFVTGSNQSEYTATFTNNRFTFARNARFGKTNAYSFASSPRQYQVALKLGF